MKKLVLAVAVLILSAASPVAAAPPGTPVADPVRTEPVTMGLGVVLTQYAQFPQSQPDPAPTDPRLMRTARINTIMEMPDGSGRRAVPDLNGKLYLVRDGVPSVFLDVAAQFQPQFFSGRGLGQGFGYVTFHPGFRTNGLFYTVHSEESAQTTARPDWQQSGTFLHNVVTEWRATNPAANTFAGTRREVLRLGFGGQIHGIQEINFNPFAKSGDPDYGLLYLAVGDGGLGVGNTEPQNLSLPYGKLLRLDPRGTDAANHKYGIPPQNPFVGRAGALGEVYAYGFRDPHRFSWDKATGRMYLGHIGEKTIEAVYEVRAGDNLGWSNREGTWVFDRAATNPCDRLYPLPANDAQLGYTYPVAMYDHNPPPGWNCTDDVGVAIAGGFVYRGTALPALQGKYVFGDLVDGRLYYTEASAMVRGGPLATIHRLHVFDAAGTSVRMRDLSAPGAPGDPDRVEPARRSCSPSPAPPARAHAAPTNTPC
ncbi:PQQ-dependent sugar dehydrogenase [Paractinoplanes lichenicola]|uniref:PQQ-dependent sugar dehydrogenase n=1 Tax=Paractinoplanes lichenicola TaxID=2802976 RepID=UPI001F1EAF65|nr:PQQ-dependent sugar dehydrogenase [Actinoplanes lichenicola]